MIEFNVDRLGRGHKNLIPRIQDFFFQAMTTIFFSAMIDMVDLKMRCNEFTPRSYGLTPLVQILPPESERDVFVLGPKA